MSSKVSHTERACLRGATNAILSSRRRWVVYGLGVSAFAAFTLVCPAAFQSWTGNASGFWSDPNNWNPVGVPENGATLWFNDGSNTSMVNDLPNLRVHSLEFFNHSYVVSGNVLTIGSDGWTGSSLETEDDTSVTINCPIVLGGDVLIASGSPFGPSRLRLNANLDLNGQTASMLAIEGGTLEVAGSISGTGRVHVTESFNDDGGTIEFLGSADNTFSGTMTAGRRSKFQMPTINFNKEAGSAVAGRLEVTNGMVVHFRRPHQIRDDGTVCISGGGQLLLHGNTETIGNLCLTNASGDTAPSLVDTGGAALLVQGDIIAVNDSTGVVPTIRGQLSLPGPQVAGSKSNHRSPLTKQFPVLQQLVPAK